MPKKADIESMPQQAERLKCGTRIERIYDELRDRICLLVYKPGTILKESDLAKEFNVSRTPMRQALQRLQFEQLVETKKAVGTVVTGYKFEALKNAYQVRIEILDMVANLAKRTYSQVDIDGMEKLLVRTATLNRAKDVHEYWSICNKIHEVLSRIIDNQTLYDICNSLYYKTSRNWFHFVDELWDQNIKTLYSEIEEEIKPMKIGDTKGTLMVRRNYILIFLSHMEYYRISNGTDFE